MKAMLLSLIVLVSSNAFATTITCGFGEKELVLEVVDQKVLYAFWSNPDWGSYGEHQLELSQVNYIGNEAIVSNDAIPDVNGTYTCN